MNDSLKLTLPKVERLNSRILIERLFTGGSKSLPAFPLRIVYMPVEGENLPAATILISVPKKRFKRAVKRNRVKRQVREAYRKNKHILLDALKNSGRKLPLPLSGSTMSCMNRPMWKLKWLNCCNLPQNVWHEKATFFSAPASHLFLPELHFTLYASLLSIHSDLLSICHRSDTKARTFQRALLSHTTHSSLPPLGRFGI